MAEEVRAPAQQPAVGVLDVAGDNEALVARNGTGINTIADLRGKKVATAFASTAHYSLLTALDKAGVTDAQVINLAPDAIRGAWGGGQIDATYIWEPTLSQLGGTALTTSAQVAEQGAPTYDLEGARGDFVKNNPGFLKAWTAAQGWAALTTEIATARSVAGSTARAPPTVET